MEAEGSSKIGNEPWQIWQRPDAGVGRPGWAVQAETFYGPCCCCCCCCHCALCFPCCRCLPFYLQPSCSSSSSAKLWHAMLRANHALLLAPHSERVLQASLGNGARTASRSRYPFQTACVKHEMPAVICGMIQSGWPASRACCICMYNDIRGLSGQALSFPARKCCARGTPCFLKELPQSKNAPKKLRTADQSERQMNVHEQASNI